MFLKKLLQYMLTFVIVLLPFEVVPVMTLFVVPLIEFLLKALHDFLHQAGVDIHTVEVV